MNYRKILSILMLMLVVVGCNPLWVDRPTSSEIIGEAWSPPSSLKPATPIYCYKTLADNQCYTEPLKHERSATRLKGAYYDAQSIHKESVYNAQDHSDAALWDPQGSRLIPIEDDDTIE